MKTLFAALLLLSVAAVEVHAAPGKLPSPVRGRTSTFTRGASKFGVSSFTLGPPLPAGPLATKPIAKGNVELVVPGAANQALAKAWMKEVAAGTATPSTVTLVVAQGGKTERYLFKAAFATRFTPPTASHPNGPATLKFAHGGGTYTSGSPPAP